MDQFWFMYVSTTFFRFANAKFVNAAVAAELSILAQGENLYFAGSQDLFVALFPATTVDVVSVVSGR